MKNNVLLISVVEKCYPDETRATCQIREKLKADEFAEALRMANEGLHLGKKHMRGKCSSADTFLHMQSHQTGAKHYVAGGWF